MILEDDASLSRRALLKHPGAREATEIPRAADHLDGRHVRWTVRHVLNIHTHAVLRHAPHAHTDTGIGPFNHVRWHASSVGEPWARQWQREQDERIPGTAETIVLRQVEQ